MESSPGGTSVSDIFCDKEKWTSILTGGDTSLPRPYRDTRELRTGAFSMVLRREIELHHQRRHADRKNQIDTDTL